LTLVESLTPDNRELRQGKEGSLCRQPLREFSVVRWDRPKARQLVEIDQPLDGMISE
jgi:hypothetical protein